MKGACIDCGEPAQGDRCQRHYFEHRAAQAAAADLERDREMVRLVDEVGVKLADLAVGMGVTRQRASVVVARARRRLAGIPS